MKDILVRYGELTLKGNNRIDFINKLIQNIKFKLKPYKDGIEYHKDNNSLIIGVEDKFAEPVFEQLKTVFGIYSLSWIEKATRKIEAIIEAVLKVAQQNSQAQTFKLEVDRKDKSFSLTSQELKQEIAPVVLKENPHLKVDVNHPQLKIEVVVKKDHVDVFGSRVDGLKGLPVGVSGTGLSMLSGGIDSPVASFLGMKRGMKINFLHFMTPPHTTSEALNKVFKLAEQLAKFNYHSFSLFVCDFSSILKELNHLADVSYKITIMRRMFVRIANQLANKTETLGIITGESLGQVASQTIESINVINNVSGLPILRPVLTNDKEEIIQTAKKIGTYETSILPFDDVCSMFVPKNPVIKPKIKVAEFNEKNLLWEELLTYTVDNLIEEYLWRNDHFEKVTQRR